MSEYVFRNLTARGRGQFVITDPIISGPRWLAVVQALGLLGTITISDGSIEAWLDGTTTMRGDMDGQMCPTDGSGGSL